jgi:hypothetical protein
MTILQHRKLRFNEDLFIVCPDQEIDIDATVTGALGRCHLRMGSNRRNNRRHYDQS